VQSADALEDQAVVAKKADMTMIAAAALAMHSSSSGSV
jgi:hypothetical protein